MSYTDPEKKREYQRFWQLRHKGDENATFDFLSNRQPPVQRECIECRKAFTVHVSDIRRGHGECCSRKCVDLHRTRPLTERFWEKVNKDGPIPAHRPDLGQCWLFTGTTNKQGYGEIRRGGKNGGALLLATHVGYELQVGPIEGLWALHYCDNPPCVRGSHLFLGTHQDNMRDMVQKGRQNNGHKRDAAL